MSENTRESEFDSTDDVDTDRQRATGTSTPSDIGRLLSGIVAVSGLWLITQAFLFTASGAASFWNNVVVGSALVVLGGYNLYRETTDATASTAVAALIALFGLWLFVAPFVYDAGFTLANVTTDMSYWNSVTVGAIAVALGSYSFLKARGATRTPTTG